MGAQREGCGGGVSGGAMSGERKRAALAYAGRGWRVFPLHWIREDGSCSCDHKNPARCSRDEPKGWGKHPLTEHGFKDASADPQQVERWWDRWPEANIGIATGAESGLVVLDVDPPEGFEQLSRIEQHHGAIPPTLTARSGRGGRHYYLAHPGGRVSNREDLLQERRFGSASAGIDVRGDGGYILAPPSRNAAGAYVWAELEETPPAVIPPALLPVIVEARTPLRRKKSDDRQAEEPRASESTKGAHDTGRDLAWALVHGGMRDPAQIARYVDAVDAHRAAHEGARRQSPSDIEREVSSALAKLKGEPEPSAESIREKLAAKWKTLGELAWLQTEPPERECLVRFPNGKKQEGTIPLGRVGLFTGGGGQGKSWLLTQLAVSVASGSVWLGTYTPTKSGRVLLVFAEEDADEMHRRVKWAAESLPEQLSVELAENLVPLPLMGEDVALTRTDPKTSETHETAFAEAIRAKLAEEEWRLVVLDPLARFAGPEVEVDNAAATRFVQTLETLTRGPGNPALVMSHHTTKASRSASGDETAARGASALVDGARWVAHVEAPVTKDRDAQTGRKKIHSFAVLKFTKVNYGVWPDEVTLKRREHGVLHLADEDEQRELERLKKPPKKESDGEAPETPRSEKGKKGKAAAAGSDAAEELGLT